MFVGKLCGLLAIISIPSILKILVGTKQSSTPSTAYRRYMATIFHTDTWYNNPLEPGSKSWRSLATVRKRHVRVSKRFLMEKTGPISQRDVAITQFGFIGYIILKPKLLGIKRTDPDEAALIHFWRVLGYMLGMEDRFNVCTNSVEQTKARLEIILVKHLRPSLETAPQLFYDMAQVLVDGLWSYNIMLNTNAFVYFIKRLSGCRGYFYWESEIQNDGFLPIDDDDDVTKTMYNNNVPTLGWYSRFMLWIGISIQQFLIPISFFRLFFNFYLWMGLFFAKYLPLLAIIRFGRQKAYVNILVGEENHPVVLGADG